MTSGFIEFVVRSINEGDISLVSFDLFDTLIMRRFSTPDEVFYQTALNLYKKNILSLSPREYIRYRKQAERQALAQSKKQDVTLDEIFNYIPLDNVICQRIKLEEQAVESQYSFLNNEIQELITFLANKNISILFVSDMYFNATYIKDVFLKNMELDSIPLYVSCETGFSKRSGSLYHFIAESKSVSFNQWIHIGDNVDSDIKMARNLGIQTIHYGHSPYFNKVKSIESKKYLISPDYQSVRNLASINFLSNKYENLIHQLGSVVWGPILLSFCDWVIEQLQRHNISSLVCILREGRLFASLIKVRLEQRNIHDVNVIVFPCSRFASFIPSVDTRSENWLDDLLISLSIKKGYTLEHLIDYFGLPKPEVLKNYFDRELTDILDPSKPAYRCLLQLKTYLETHKNTINNIIKKENKLLNNYFSTIVKTDLSQCALLDLGGGGTIIYQLEATLKVNSALRLLFYSTDRVFRYLNSRVFHSFLGEYYNADKLCAVLNRSFQVIEPLLVGTEGSVTGYVEKNAVIYPLQSSSLDKNRILISTFENAVRRFFNLFHFYNFKRIDIKDAGIILERFLSCPILEEGELYTQIVHEENNGVNKQEAVISQAHIDKIKEQSLDDVYLQLVRSTNFYASTIPWPEGVMTSIDENRFMLHGGISLNKNSDNVECLLQKIINQGWSSFAVWGAGKLFEDLLAKIQPLGLEVQFLIDKKAELSNYNYMGYQVVSFEQATLSTPLRIVIASYAFKNDIIKSINTKLKSQPELLVDVISL